MVGKLLGLFLLLLVVQNSQCQDPPEMTGSYIAWGEIVQTVPDTDNLIVLQLSFEESYDANAQNSAFFLWMSGKNMTFIKNFKINQTFLYVESKDKKMECSETSEREWVESEFPPGLNAFEDDDGTVKFSLTQMFNLPKKYLRAEEPQGVPIVYRGIPSKVWTYEIKTKKVDEDSEDSTDVSLEISSYWSDEKWNTSGGKKMIPLGFNVSKVTWTKNPDNVTVDDYVINILGFVPNAYDHKYFEPFQGTICESRKSTLKFPSIKNIRAISLHSEMALPDYQELRYIDTWFDPFNELMRVDVETLKGEEFDGFKFVKRYQSDIAIGKMDVVFRLKYDKGESQCVVIPFEEYQTDLVSFFDIKQDLKRWHMGKLFGLNDTTYVYIGKTIKNDVPCHLFQGIRTDWPDKSSKMESLWEWCFNVNMTNENDVVLFQDDEFGLINANVIVLSDPESIWNNYRMNHHFYEVKAQDPKILDATSFDIGRCFKDTQKKLLQFYLNVGIADDNKDLAENATSDASFLQKWKDAIYWSSGLPKYSLRVSDVRATINEGKLYIMFALLPAHKDLPEDAKGTELPLFDAETNLRKDVNKEKVSIMHAWYKGKIEKLYAVKQSVSYQINPDFVPHPLPTLPPTTPQETTPFVFSLRTEPHKDKTGSTKAGSTVSKSVKSDSTDSYTGSTPSMPDVAQTTPVSRKEKRIVKMTGHGPGTVAGVSIAMLLIGITMGSFSTFYKLNGLPACMKSSEV